MSRLAPITLVMLIMLLAACSAPSKPKTVAQESAKAQEPPQPAEAVANQAIAMSGVDLRMYHVAPTVEGARKPAFWIHAEALVLPQEQGAQSFEKAHAVLYAQAEGKEDMVFDAGRGSYWANERALLSGGVIARSGTMTIEMTDVEWLNTEREAKTDHPVIIRDGETHIEAETLRLYPDRDEFVITHGKGVVQMERSTP